MVDPQDNANLAAALVVTADEHPDAIAVKLDDIELSYQALEQVTRRVAGLLRAEGVEPGDRVGIMLPNVPHFPLAYFGALRLGAIVVPMNPLLSAREVTYYLEDSGAKVLLAWHGFAEAAMPGAEQAGATFVEVDPDTIGETIGAADPVDEVHAAAADDTAVLLYTSGTTGQPKGAELTHANIGSNVQACLGLFSPEPGDVIFGGLPFFHVFGQTCALNTAVKAGATITLVPRFEPGKALEVMARDRVTVFMGVADDVRRAAAPPRSAEHRHVVAAPVRLRRLGAAGRGPQGLRGRLRLQDPRGLRALGDLAGGLLQPPAPRAQARLDRDGHRARGDAPRRRRRQRGPRGGARRDRGSAARTS